MSDIQVMRLEDSNEGNIRYNLKDSSGERILVSVKYSPKGNDLGYTHTFWKADPEKDFHYFFERFKEFHHNLENIPNPFAEKVKLLGIQIGYASKKQKWIRDKYDLTTLESSLNQPFNFAAAKDKLCCIGFLPIGFKEPWNPKNGLLQVMSHLDISEHLADLVSKTSKIKITSEVLLDHLKEHYNHN